MITLDIAKDFSTAPGARYYKDGPASGEEFFEKLLRPRYEQATAKNVKLKIILDGTDGMASSFINEAFRRLATEFGADNVWNTLMVVSDEVPKYITKVREAIYEGKKN